MPRETLTAEQIVRAAIELLDEDGLDGLNMRTLGQRLGSAATAIYWHIRTKDELVRLAADQVWTQVARPDPAEHGWRAAAAETATSLHAVLTRHPWLGQAVGSHLMYGPGKARFDEHCLAVYEHAGFSPADADRAAATVLLFVLGSALGPAAQVSLTRRLARGGKDPAAELAATAAKAREHGLAHPRLKQRLEDFTATGEGYAAAPERTFEFGLESILDGFGLRLGSG